MKFLFTSYAHLRKALCSVSSEVLRSWTVKLTSLLVVLMMMRLGRLCSSMTRSLARPIAYDTISVLYCQLQRRNSLFLTQLELLCNMRRRTCSQETSKLIVFYVEMSFAKVSSTWSLPGKASARKHLSSTGEWHRRSSVCHYWRVCRCRILWCGVVAACKVPRRGMFAGLRTSSWWCFCDTCPTVQQYNSNLARCRKCCT